MLDILSFRLNWDLNSVFWKWILTRKIGTSSVFLIGISTWKRNIRNREMGISTSKMSGCKGWLRWARCSHRANHDQIYIYTSTFVYIYIYIYMHLYIYIYTWYPTAMQYPSSYSLTYKETIGLFRGARPRALAYNELIHWFHEGQQLIGAFGLQWLRQGIHQVLHKGHLENSPTRAEHWRSTTDRKVLEKYTYIYIHL